MGSERIRFSCSGCQQQLATEASQAGKRVACPTCRRTLVVPSPAVRHAEPLMDAAPAVPRPAPEPIVLDNPIVLPDEPLPEGEPLPASDNSLAFLSETQAEQPARTHASQPPPLPSVRDLGSPTPVGQSAGAFRRYLNWCGTRSLIFQVLLAAWTGFIALFWLASAFSAVSRHSNDNEAAAAALLFGMCCFGGFWFLVAFPLGIAAIATFEGKKATDQVAHSTSGSGTIPPPPPLAFRSGWLPGWAKLTTTHIVLILVFAIPILLCAGLFALAILGGTNNARCRVCGYEWRISEEYRDNISGQLVQMRCPRCGQEWPVFLLYREYDDHHGRSGHAEREAPQDNAHSKIVGNDAWNRLEESVQKTPASSPMEGPAAAPNIPAEPPQ